MKLILSKALFKNISIKIYFEYLIFTSKNSNWIDEENKQFKEMKLIIKGYLKTYSDFSLQFLKRLIILELIELNFNEEQILDAIKDMDKFEARYFWSCYNKIIIKIFLTF